MIRLLQTLIQARTVFCSRQQVYLPLPSPFHYSQTRKQKFPGGGKIQERVRPMTRVSVNRNFQV